MRRIVLALALALALAPAACTSSGDVLEPGDNAHQLSAVAKSSMSTQTLQVAAVTVADLDGDGIDDLVITDSAFKPPGGDQDHEGALYVVYGRNPFPDTIDLTTVPRLENDVGPIPFDRVKLVPGDFDGDGLTDLAVVHDCRYEAPQIAGAYILYGARQRLSGSQGIAAAAAAHFSIEDACERQGAAIDLDGDGKSDLVLSFATNVSVTLPTFGRVYLFYGGARWTGDIPVTTADAVITQPLVGAGSILAPIGDVDGDGHADLLVADNGHYGDSYDKMTRNTYIVYGGAQRLHGALVASDLGTLLTGFIAFEGDRIAVGLGDLDGDGVDDFAVTSGNEAELASIFYGRRGGFGARISTGQADAKLINHEGGDPKASLVSSGVIDASGHPGLVLGDPTRGEDRGAVYVLPGGTRYTGEVDVDQQTTVFFGGILHEKQCDFFSPGNPCDLPAEDGEIIASGDLDGDGHPDLVVADSDYILGSNDSSRIYILPLDR